MRRSLLLIIVLTIFETPLLQEAKTVRGQEWGPIRAANQNSVMFIESKRFRKDGTGAPDYSYGTGFIISPNGYVITNSHVVLKPDPSTEVETFGAIRSRHNQRYPLEIIKRDEETDLMLLMLPDTSEAWQGVEFGDSHSVPKDEPLYALGFPASLDLSPATGILSSTSSTKGRWQTTLLINRGQSGAPVFDANGKVVAIAVAGMDAYQGITFAIPEAHARGLRQMAQQSGKGPRRNDSQANATDKPSSKSGSQNVGVKTEAKGSKILETEVFVDEGIGAQLGKDAEGAIIRGSKITVGNKPDDSNREKSRTNPPEDKADDRGSYNMRGKDNYGVVVDGPCQTVQDSLVLTHGGNPAISFSGYGAVITGNVTVNLDQAIKYSEAFIQQCKRQKKFGVVRTVYSKLSDEALSKKALAIAKGVRGLAIEMRQAQEHRKQLTLAKYEKDHKSEVLVLRAEMLNRLPKLSCVRTELGSPDAMDAFRSSLGDVGLELEILAHEIWTPYREFSDEELSKRTLGLAMGLRGLAIEKRRRDDQITGGCDKPSPGPSADERSRSNQIFWAQYVDQYESEVVILRAEMLHRLPEVGQKTRRLMVFPLNTVILETIASQLEQLAQLLPSALSKTQGALSPTDPRIIKSDGAYSSPHSVE